MKFWLKLLLYFTLLFNQVLCAQETPLLLQRIQAARPDQEALQRAEKQIADLKDLTLRDISLGPFHKRKAEPILATGQVYCTGCHLPLPHQKRLRSRAFYNMHTQYLACETCHYRPEDVTLTYRWYDYQTKAEAEVIAGRFYAGRGKEDADPLLKRDGSVKIAPFYGDQPVLITREHSFSQELQALWKAADEQQRVQIKASIHMPLQQKGAQCVACHTREEGMLDLAALSATPEQIKKIEQNTIADFFKHYQADEAAGDSITDEKEQRIRITDLLN